MSDILEGLNDRQLEAASHVNGPLLIIAGAGSGKTNVITRRIAYLIKEKGIDPYNIMAITFTNKAAGEMRERVDRYVGMGSEGVWVATFHSSCVRILRRHIDQIGYDTHFTIYDTDDSKSVMKAVMKKLQIDPKQIKEATILREISNAKNDLIGPDEYEEIHRMDFGKRQIVRAYLEYQDTLRKNNALDFDDLIRMTVYLFKACPEVLANYQDRFRYICVDEYQDTNTAQFELVKLLAGVRKNICVVGDDDQSIYKFRGANIMNILNFENVFKGAKVVKLEQNYRSTQNILNAANAVIAHNRGRKTKRLWTERESDVPVYFNVYGSSGEEAAQIANDIARLKAKGHAEYNDCAILYRTNAQSREFEEAFVRENIPYYIVGGINFYARKEIKDVLAYLKTVDNASDDLAVRRIINVPRRSIGATTVQKVSEYADMRMISFFEACRRAKEIEGLGKAAGKLVNFAQMIEGYREDVKEYGISAMAIKLLDETGYVEEIKDTDEDDAQERIENIEELMNRISSYEEQNPEGTLSGFLEEVALVSDIDNADQRIPRVYLMTVHSAKGLEFSRVYLCGMEEGVFPGNMSINSGHSEDIEEERRLAYVAITRAKDVLKISAAKSRRSWGETQYNAVSRFIKEIPEEYLSGDLNRVRRESYELEERGYSRNRFDDDIPFGGGNDDNDFFGSILKARKQKKETPKEVIPKEKPVMKLGSELTGGKPDYEVGDTVEHVKYGRGKVLEMEKGPKDYKVTVLFDEAGQKIMYAAFAKLKKI